MTSQLSCIEIFCVLAGMMKMETCQCHYRLMSCVPMPHPLHHPHLLPQGWELPLHHPLLLHQAAPHLLLLHQSQGDQE